MITRIEAKGYKCLADVAVDVGPLNVLVGPNASGKSTLLDVLGFLHDALRRDWDADRALRKRARHLEELLWRGRPRSFSVALTAARARLGEAPTYAGDPERLTYAAEVGIGPDGALGVLCERLEAPGCGLPPLERGPAGLFTGPPPAPGWPVLAVRAEAQDLALSAVDTWLRDLLRDRVHFVQLDPVAMRKRCPPDAPREFQPDGSNLPFLVQQLHKQAPDRFAWWLDHLRTVLEGLQDIEVREQPDDRHLFLVASFANGLQVPSWLLSDGTLRFLALTLIAYLPTDDHIYVIEEPENGIHPKALEALMDSLKSVYEGQVFIATHSPLIVDLVELDELLCFSLDANGATQIVRGSEHPWLQDWHREVPLSRYFAAGVLG